MRTIESTGFTVKPKTVNDTDRMGIYRIWFGEMYYIGSTIDTTKRMKQHQAAIRKAIEKAYILDASYLKNILSYLRANGELLEAQYELVQGCKDYQELLDAEFMWLKAHEGRMNCLNESFNPGRHSGGVTFKPSENSEAIQLAVKLIYHT